MGTIVIRQSLGFNHLLHSRHSVLDDRVSTIVLKSLAHGRAQVDKTGTKGRITCQRGLLVKVSLVARQVVMTLVVSQQIVLVRRNTMALRALRKALCHRQQQLQQGRKHLPDSSDHLYLRRRT